jgi:hypothetical protein
MMTFLMGTMKFQVRSLYAGIDFASTFKDSLKIYHHHEDVTGLKGTAKDTNGKHIRNVLIELVNFHAPGESTFRSTNSDGNYSFKKIDLTSVTMRVRALGYTTAEYIVTIEKDKMTNFDILLIPEPAPVL